MTKPMHKSRSFRRMQKRIVGGTVARYVERKSGHTKCAKCKIQLKGMAKSDRIFNGYLCADCVRQKIVIEARQLSFKKE